MYDTQETQILEKSTAFVQFLTRKGVLEDQNIDDEKVRKAKKSTVQKAYPSCPSGCDLLPQATLMTGWRFLL